jgi:glutamate-1-semialdehyde 2,1-aminomutase
VVAVLETQQVRRTDKSQALSEEIVKLIPGGVNSPFRSFGEVGGHTIFFDKAEGAYMWDVDGNRYIDYLGAWGPAILGHCPPAVVGVSQKMVATSPVLGTPHRFELKLAQQLTALVPSVERVRFVNSGTEAVMSAVRLARGFKKRDLIVMFEGCYHGHSDSVLASRSHSSSGGVPRASASNTLLVPFNDTEALSRALLQHKKEVAAVIIEPVAGSMGVIPPLPGYLEAVRKLCTEQDVVLIFDEVLTGLRVARGGAQALYNISPDLTCFGKALCGGLPIGAYGGRAEIMSHLLPEGDVYQAGTFSGNPATMAAAIQTLILLDVPGVYERLDLRTAQLFDGVRVAAKKAGVELQLQRVGSMFALLFAPKPVRNYKDSLKIDAHAFSKFFHHLLEHGVYLPPSAVDAACVSAAHSEADIEETVRVCAEALNALDK